MKIRLNRAQFPVTTLGPGQRIGLWVQGCHIRCPGCVARDTWESDPTKEVELDFLLAWCRNAAGEYFEGVTISGGEPFEQPEALLGLLEGLNVWRRELARPFDILCYSGFSFRRLKRCHSEILAQLDALIPEPYVDHLPRGALWRGSKNQPLMALSPLGRERYAPFLAAVAGEKGVLQFSVEGNQVVCVGIPDRKDMERLAAAVRRRGVELRGTSWRA